MSNLIEITNITKRYEMGDNVVMALQNVNLNIIVESFAIQAENLTTEDTKNPVKVWDILSNQANV